MMHTHRHDYFCTNPPSYEIISKLGSQLKVLKDKSFNNNYIIEETQEYERKFIFLRILVVMCIVFSSLSIKYTTLSEENSTNKWCA